MHLCVPVLDDSGLDSRVCSHFGSAPAFLIVDTDAGSYRCVANDTSHHDHGTCQPLRRLDGESVDGIVVGGIGPGALSRLRAAGIPVYRAAHATVGETIAAFKRGVLRPMDERDACALHGGHSHV